MNFLELFNQVSRIARPVQGAFSPLISMNEDIKAGGLDSMDILLVCIYMAELYGITDEIAKTMLPTTPQELLDFLNKHKTQEPASVEEAMEHIK